MGTAAALGLLINAGVIALMRGEVCNFARGTAVGTSEAKRGGRLIRLYAHGYAIGRLA